MNKRKTGRYFRFLIKAVFIKIAFRINATRHWKYRKKEYIRLRCSLQDTKIIDKKNKSLAQYSNR